MDPLSSYRLSSEIWQDSPHYASAYLQTGSNYGMLWIQYMCSCSEHTSLHACFFTTKEDDKVVRIMGFCKQLNGSIQVRLPYGVLGNFKPVGGPPHTNDALILRSVVNVYYYDEQLNWSVHELFANIRSTLQMRAAFKRLWRFQHRTNTISLRLLVLRLLFLKGIYEPMLRMRILCRADLW